MGRVLSLKNAGVEKETKEGVLRREVSRRDILKHCIYQKVKKDEDQQKWD